MNYGDRDH